MCEIAIEAFAPGSDLGMTLERRSDLASVYCRVAIRGVLADLYARHGRPRSATGERVTPIVLGMGKLGGRELNFSSDIDLIFLHTADGVTDGPNPIENERFFVKLAQDVGKLLSEHTADGFVFRVDTMLRPFGSARPISMSSP